MSAENFDIIIVGGGIVGLSLALALSENPNLKIAVLEKNKFESSYDEHHYHHRVSAISKASKNILQHLRVWSQLNRVSPFNAMTVWDETNGAKLHFENKDVGEVHLGYIIENNVLQNALLQSLSLKSQIQLFAPVEVTAYQPGKMTLKDGRHLTAKLCIAADGANSWLREQSGIAITKKNYEQAAIVGTVKTACSHQKTAWQVFLNEGPLAFLPLEDPHFSSIVWTVPAAKAETFQQMKAKDFNDKLNAIFSSHLGSIELQGQCFSFPLFEIRAAQYVADQLALVGDAAHSIHPLAGQGVNLGLLDAASLAQIILAESTISEVIATKSLLRKYERWRKADNFLMLNLIDQMQKIFSTEKNALRSFGSWGFKMVQQNFILKKTFIDYAIGKRRHLPKLAQSYCRN